MKKSILSIVGVVMLVGALAGCGGTASTGAASPAVKSSAVSSSSAAASSSEASSSATSSSAASSAAVGSSSAAGASQASGTGGAEVKLKVWGPEMLSPEESLKVCDVKAAYEKDAANTSKDYITYEPVDKNEFTSYVIFTAKKEVKKFRIVDLETNFVDENGNADFIVHERLNVDSLTSAKSLRAGYNFGETLPTCGFMYTDDSGKDRLFALGMSGMDGSLLMWEIKSK